MTHQKNCPIISYPAIATPAQAICNRWQEKRERLRKLFNGAINYDQRTRYEAAIDEIDLFLADLRQTFRLPNDPPK